MGDDIFRQHAPMAIGQRQGDGVERLEAREDSLAVIVYGNEHATSLFTRRR